MIPRYLQGGAKRVAYSSAVNIAADGDSITVGQGSSSGQTYPVQLSAQAPLMGSGVAAITNLGVGAQSWKNMTGLTEPNGGNPSTSIADVSAAWVNGKTNILLAHNSNSPYFNGSAAQSIADAAAYCAAVLAVHPWKIVLATIFPRLRASSPTPGGQTYAQLNATFMAYNATLLSTFRSMGAVAVVDLAPPGSVWGNLYAGGDFTSTAFNVTAVNSLYDKAGDSGDWIHPVNAGYALMAAQWAATLRRVPA
jgi:hypothetical protein